MDKYILDDKIFSLPYEYYNRYNVKIKLNTENDVIAMGGAIYIEPTPEELLEKAKTTKISEVDEYDVSNNVNEFFYNGKSYWIPRETRTSLMNSTSILKASGEETTTLWLGDDSVTLNCDIAIGILSAIEIYALKCYNVTAQHKSEIRSLTIIEDVEGYDVTSDYPEKLSF